MSTKKDYVVVLTFDLLNKPETKFYSQIKTQLKTLDLLKTDLFPGNIFIGTFPIEDYDDASQLKDTLSSQVKEIFKGKQLDAKYLLVVGEDWDGIVKIVKNT